MLLLSLLLLLLRKMTKYKDLVEKKKSTTPVLNSIYKHTSSIWRNIKDFLDMLAELGLDPTRKYSILRDIVNTTIRKSYFIFCCKTKNDEIQISWNIKIV